MGAAELDFMEYVWLSYLVLNAGKTEQWNYVSI